MTINERPEFAAAMRGYDRQQVDDYVQVVLQYVEELELRASEAAEAAGRVRAPHSASPGAGQAEPARARAHAPIGRGSGPGRSGSRRGCRLG